jgi:methylphosphotriester-DNA--protein-cysteine methyltransferase
MPRPRRDPPSTEFFVAVKTTRIFCRSVCHARTPKPENVEFFPKPHDAL